MGLDTQEKRMAATGVGRPWMRAKLPGANDQEWRIASGNAYGGNALSAVTVTVPQTQIPRVAVSSSQIPRDPYVVFDINQHIHQEIDGRLTGVDLSLFSTFTPPSGPFVWSTTCWAKDLVFTGQSHYNDGANKWAGTLISPRHVALAKHAHPTNGTVLTFIQADGTPITRTISDHDHTVTSDIAIAYLDSDVTEVSFYKVLPSDYADYFTPNDDDLTCAVAAFTNGLQGKPIIVTDQDEKALVAQILTFDTSLYWVKGQGDRLAYSEDTVEDDSGHPGFLVFGSELVFLGTNWSFTAGGACGQINKQPFYGDASIQSRVNTIMSNLDTADTGYQLTLFDFEAFIARMRRESVAASGIGRVAVGSSTLVRV